jgi:hypothetical protein
MNPQHLAYCLPTRRIISAVITGFNTDIEYNGVTYHVQTEDKGVETPLILSLVYNRGTILASKRSPYDDLLNGGLDEKQLAERLQKQHKLICAAVKAGRIEDLKRMTMRESESKKKGLVAQKEVKIAPPAVASTAAPPPPPEITKTEIKREEAARPPVPFAPQPKPKPFNPRLEIKPPSAASIEASRQFEESVIEIPMSVLDDVGPIIEAVEIIEEEVILPVDAVEIITDFTRGEPAGEEARLVLELLNSPTFKGGERKTLSIMVSRRGGRGGDEGSGLSGAHVMVKVLGTAFRPLIFHARTDSNGIAIVHLQLPHFKTGRAALLVRAMSGGEEVELRRVIQHS